MRYLLTFLLLMNTAWAVGPIGTIGNVPMVNFGKVQLPNFIRDPDVKVLNTHLSCNSATRRSTLRTAAGVAYQVSGTFNTSAIALHQTSIGSEGPVNLFYSDNDVGIDTTTAATNPVYYKTFSSTFVNAFYLNTSTAGNSLSSFAEYPVQFEAPNTKYVGVECQTTGSGTMSIIVSGIEQ